MKYKSTPQKKAKIIKGWFLETDNRAYLDGIRVDSDGNRVYFNIQVDPTVEK